MNVRGELQEVSKYLADQEIWLFGRISDDPKALASIADRVIEAAEKLARSKQERLNELSQKGPQVHKMACGEITVTLLRQGKEEFYHAGDYYIQVERTSKDEVREHFKLTGPPENDGNTYMLRFKPLGLGPQEYAIQVSAWEANIIHEQLEAIY